VSLPDVEGTVTDSAFDTLNMIYFYHLRLAEIALDRLVESRTDIKRLSHLLVSGQV
jgi:hypothetical protein